MKLFAFIPILAAFSSLSTSMISAAPFRRIASTLSASSGSLLLPLDGQIYSNMKGAARLTLQYQKVSSSSESPYQTNSIMASLVPIGEGIHTPGQTIRLPKYFKTFGEAKDVIVGTFFDLHNVCGKYSIHIKEYQTSDGVETMVMKNSPHEITFEC